MAWNGWFGPIKMLSDTGRNPWSDLTQSTTWYSGLVWPLTMITDVLKFLSWVQVNIFYQINKMGWFLVGSHLLSKLPIGHEPYPIQLDWSIPGLGSPFKLMSWIPYPIKLVGFQLSPYILPTAYLLLVLSPGQTCSKLMKVLRRVGLWPSS